MSIGSPEKTGVHRNTNSFLFISSNGMFMRKAHAVRLGHAYGVGRSFSVPKGQGSGG